MKLLTSALLALTLISCGAKADTLNFKNTITHVQNVVQVNVICDSLDTWKSIAAAVVSGHMDAGKKVFMLMVKDGRCIVLPDRIPVFQVKKVLSFVDPRHGDADIWEVKYPGAERTFFSAFITPNKSS
tara:strand:- start:2012 stop:2395 length:384 start_codon:yes stop_codon:yes gene_type:complete